MVFAALDERNPAIRGKYCGEKGSSAELEELRRIMAWLPKYVEDVEHGEMIDGVVKYLEGDDDA